MQLLLPFLFFFLMFGADYEDQPIGEIIPSLSVETYWDCAQLDSLFAHQPITMKVELFLWHDKDTFILLRQYRWDLPEEICDSLNGRHIRLGVSPLLAFTGSEHGVVYLGFALVQEKKRSITYVVPVSLYKHNRLFFSVMKPDSCEQYVPFFRSRVARYLRSLKILYTVVDTLRQLDSLYGISCGSDTLSTDMQNLLKSLASELVGHAGRLEMALWIAARLSEHLISSQWKSQIREEVCLRSALFINSVRMRERLCPRIGWDTPVIYLSLNERLIVNDSFTRGLALLLVSDSQTAVAGRINHWRNSGLPRRHNVQILFLDSPVLAYTEEGIVYRLPVLDSFRVFYFVNGRMVWVSTWRELDSLFADLRGDSVTFELADGRWWSGFVACHGACALSMVGGMPVVKGEVLWARGVIPSEAYGCLERLLLHSESNPDQCSLWLAKALTLLQQRGFLTPADNGILDRIVELCPVEQLCPV